MSRDEVRAMTDEEIIIHGLRHEVLLIGASPNDVEVVREFDGAAHLVWHGMEIGICPMKSRPYLEAMHS